MSSKPYYGPKPTYEWPRISDLPIEDRVPFENWLKVHGQTRPWIDSLPSEAQDGYFHYDYQRWCRSGKPQK